MQKTTKTTKTSKKEKKLKVESVFSGTTLKKKKTK